MANELLDQGIRDSGFQLERVFDGIQDLDAKPISTQMSPRETLAHLAEVYQAFLTTSEGGKHEWGTYEIPAEAQADIAGFAFGLRRKAVERLASDPSAKNQALALDFLVLHDPYHVGQMAQHRIATEPDWNPYSIYPGH